MADAAATDNAWVRHVQQTLDLGTIPTATIPGYGPLPEDDMVTANENK